MKSKTVEYGGRSWKHQQFYGLFRRLLDDGVAISTQCSCGVYRTVHATDYECWIGYGSTPWLALCDAVEKMEEKSG